MDENFEETRNETESSFIQEMLRIKEEEEYKTSKLRRQFNMISEKYLKLNQEKINLQRKLEECENQTAKSVEYYEQVIQNLKKEGNIHNNNSNFRNKSNLKQNKNPNTHYQANAFKKSPKSLIKNRNKQKINKISSQLQIFKRTFQQHNQMQQYTIEMVFDKCNKLIKNLSSSNQFQNDEIKKKISYLEKTPLIIETMSEQKMSQIEDLFKSIDCEIKTAKDIFGIKE